VLSALGRWFSAKNWTIENHSGKLAPAHPGKNPNAELRFYSCKLNVVALSLADNREPTTNDVVMGTRRKSRELALQMLFQADLGQQPADDVRRTFWKGRGEVEREVQGFAEDIFRVAQDRSDEIDALIKSHAENWRMDRMAAVDRNVLRAAVAEMLGYPATPRAVVINEAIEIARKFSSPESAQFINGVLDSIGKELESARGVEK